MSDVVIQCENLEAAIVEHQARGYRLDMIFPADAPREALMSKERETVRLRLQKPEGRNTQDSIADNALTDVRASATEDWIMGRAGMEYRDLIPGRLGGKVIASHIRLTNGGEVPDYVHYHKIDFQMIYCKRGRIKVVYEDEGPPFWLETGDCVLQPPEIRHRVLECTAGAEVIEVSMPAEHETWVEHEIKLPTGVTNAGRDFSGQLFVRHIAGDADDRRWRDTEIETATSGLACVKVLKLALGETLTEKAGIGTGLTFCFVLHGSGSISIDGDSAKLFEPDDSFVLQSVTGYVINPRTAVELLSVSVLQQI